MSAKGVAYGNRETFEFTIEPFVNGGYRLDIKYSETVTTTSPAGVWPTVEKAKEIAEATATKLLSGGSPGCSSKTLLMHEAALLDRVACIRAMSGDATVLTGSQDHHSATILSCEENSVDCCSDHLGCDLWAGPNRSTSGLPRR